MRDTRLFLLVALLFSSISSASAYTEEQFRTYIKLGIGMYGFECGQILEVEANDDGIAYNILCSDNTDGSGPNTHYYMLLGEGNFIVKVIDQP